MDTLNSDLILHIAQYVSVLDAANWMQTSRRFYFLIHALRTVLGPEMVAAASATPVSTALGRLRQKPTLALCCNTTRSCLEEQVAAQLPPSTVILGAIGNSIQTCLDGEVQSTSNANILLGNLGKEATIQPFVWQAQGGDGFIWDSAIEQVIKETFSTSSEYEVFLIYGCGDGSGVLEEFVQLVQSLHPQAALVGGICSSGYVSRAVTLQEMDPGVLTSKRVAVLKQMYKNLGGSTSVLKTLTEKQTLVEHVHSLLQKSPFVLEPHLDDAIFGVALGGNVPIRSVVSRGVSRLTPPDTTVLVQETRLLGPTLVHDRQDRQSFAMAPSFHVIESMVDKDTGKEFNLMSFLAHVKHVDFCGIRRRISDDQYEDSFELYAFDLHGEKLKIPVNNSDLFASGGMLSMSQSTAEPLVTATMEADCEMDGAQIDFFSLNGVACVEHVETTMERLKKQTEKDDEHVLAAIMYSCGGRGPDPGWLIRKPMADAHAFSTAFGKEVPCIGFYAGGEIGPLATAPAPDVEDRSLFQRGRAALQGFTAVFALFIAPKVDLRQVDIDDSPEHVSKFIASRLAPMVGSS